MGCDWYSILIGILILEVIKCLYRKHKNKNKAEKYIFMVFPKGYPKFWRVVDEKSIEDLRQLSNDLQLLFNVGETDETEEESKQ